MNVGIGQEWQRGVVGTVARIIGMDSGVWRQSLQALDGELEGEREEQLPGSLLEQLRGQRCHLLSIVGQERLFRAVCNQPRTIESQHDLKSWTTSVVIYFASVVPKLFLVTCKHLKNIRSLDPPYIRRHSKGRAGNPELWAAARWLQSCQPSTRLWVLFVNHCCVSYLPRPVMLTWGLFEQCSCPDAKPASHHTMSAIYHSPVNH